MKIVFNTLLLQNEKYKFIKDSNLHKLQSLLLFLLLTLYYE